MEYFTYVGSYDGAVKVRGRWVRAVELNRINKHGWQRVRPTPAAWRATKTQPPTQATALFPHLTIRSNTL